MSTTYHIIRHALTCWNEEKRIQGQTDIPLCEAGLRMALDWKPAIDALHLDGVLTSDLERARRTARIVTEGRDLELVQDARLREQDWGDWVGLTSPQIREQHAEELERMMAHGWQMRLPGGESRTEVLDRARAALLQHAADHPDETHLVVTHQGVIKCLVYDLLGRAYLPTEPAVLEPYTRATLSVDGETVTLGELNQPLVPKDDAGSDD